ncbi:DUF5134 domain-containing protein [Streptomyces sodiiphilus]
MTAAGCGATGAFCLLHARHKDAPRQRTADGAMGLGMALMALPSGVPAPPPETLAVLFAGLALWPLPGLPRGHRAHHTTEALAMVYMALSMASATGAHAAHGNGLGVPVITWALLAYYAVHLVRSGPRLVPATAQGSPRGSPGDAPCATSGVTAACRTSLSLGMLAMLLTM